MCLESWNVAHRPLSKPTRLFQKTSAHHKSLENWFIERKLWLIARGPQIQLSGPGFSQAARLHCKYPLISSAARQQIGKPKGKTRSLENNCPLISESRYEKTSESIITKMGRSLQLSAAVCAPIFLRMMTFDTAIIITTIINSHRRGMDFLSSHRLCNAVLTTQWAYCPVVPSLRCSLSNLEWLPKAEAAFHRDQQLPLCWCVFLQLLF